MGEQSPVTVAVQDPAVRDQLSRMNARIMGTDSDPFYGAPTVLVVLADKTCPTRVYDGSCVIANLLNAAEGMGLGSCWVARAKEEFESEEGEVLLRAWGLDGELEGVGHCVLGSSRWGAGRAVAWTSSVMFSRPFSTSSSIRPMPELTSTIYSIMFSSSRMFPGQPYSFIYPNCSGVRRKGKWYFSVKRSIK